LPNAPRLAMAGCAQRADRVRALALASLALAAIPSLGCWSIQNRNGDIDRSPVVNTGAGATIIYPGQNGPMHPGNYHPREAGYGQSGPANSGSASGPYGYSTGSTSGSYPVPAGAIAPQVAVPPPEYGAGSGSASSTAPAAGSNFAMLGGTEIEETRHSSVNE